MKASRFLLAPILSIVDLNLYRELRNEKFGIALLYNFYLAAIFCGAMALMATVWMPKADQFVDWLKSEYPGMTFTNGSMKLDNPGRKELIHPQWGNVVTFDDSRQTLTSEEMGTAAVFITSTMVYTRAGKTIEGRALPSGARNAATPSTTNMQLHLDGPTLQKYYQKFKWPLTIIFLIVMLLFIFISRLIAGLIFALIGFFIQLFIPRGLDFERLFILASFAYSIGVIFGIFQYVPFVSSFFPGGAGLVLSLVYFGIAITVQPKITPVDHNA